MDGRSAYLTPEQVAETLQVTTFTVYRWLRSGKLVGVKIGKLWRVRPQDLPLSPNPSQENPPHEDLPLPRPTED